MTRTLRIGTRGSQLALVQAHWVADRLAEHGVTTEITIIRTEGDDRPIDTAWGEGAFVGRIVGALLEGTVDLAVHSAKDVPTDEHPQLVIAAYPPREDPRDALVCRVRGTTLDALPPCARVGTDSPRRIAFLRAVRPDLELHPLHGNVDTRLAKLDRGDSDALVLAVAGLTRLGRADRIDDILPTSMLASAPGQGSLALQVRSDDDEAIGAVGLLDDPATRAAVQAERALLNGTGGGCRSPIGALGRLRPDGRLEVVAAAERTWSPLAHAPLADATAPIAWVRGDADPSANLALAARLADRIVTLRQRPRVLTCRTDAQATHLLRALDAHDIEAVNVPAIEIVAAPAGADLDAALRELAPGERIVVTSGNAARATLAALGRIAVPADVPSWAAVGDGSAAVLAAAGIDDPFIPFVADAATLARDLPLIPGERVLLPRSDIADDALPAALRERGAAVTEVVAYRTVEAPDASRPRLAAAFDDGPLDAVVLTSGSTARGILALAADGEARARLLAAPVIAIGEPSAAAAREAGFARIVIAPGPEPSAVAAFTAIALGTREAPHPLAHRHLPPTLEAAASREPATTGGAR
ncbi:MAG TPA: hydroxymethylbilane synthase [Candidatus Limnocylindrales bacterium]